MEKQRPIQESEYAALFHGKLVDLYQLLPKQDSHVRWKAALDEEAGVLKAHSKALDDGSESREEFLGFIKSYLDNQVNTSKLRRNGDRTRRRRGNSDKKKLILGEVGGLLKFAPTTDEFKQVTTEFFGKAFDNGRDGVSNDSLLLAVLVKDAQSGGFFNQQNACDIEVIAYRERKSWLGGAIYWNSLVDLNKGKGLVSDETYKMMYRDVDKEEVMFLEKWEQAIKDRYRIDPQVQSADTSFESEPEGSSLRVEDPRV